MTSFTELSLRAELLDALAAQGYQAATPIQAQAIPPALAGRDILGIAQTGTGKTAAFVLPILQRLAAGSRTPHPGRLGSLILTPTRELAIQIGQSISDYGANLKLSHAVIFGGVGQGAQVEALRRGLDILVATPGRLLDLMNQGHVRLDGLSVFVLDEADRMLDMGFIHDVKRVVAKLPAERQTLFFSATMPGEIASLAGRMLKNPAQVQVAPVATTAERIEQQVMHVPGTDKRAVLVALLSGDPAMSKVIAFTRTKHGANKVAETLEKNGIVAAAIHGNKSQNARQAALEGFRAGRVRVLVATDLAARGIDVDGITHVVNFELPNVPETYVHRIGRTARAGAAGIAIALCDGGEERTFLRDIEKLTRVPLTVVPPPAYTPLPASAAAPAGHHRPAGRPQGSHGHGGHGHAGHGQRPGGQGQRRGPAPSGSSRPAQPAAAQPQRTDSRASFHGFADALEANERARGGGQGERRPQPSQPQRQQRPAAGRGFGGRPSKPNGRI
jgi:ATP-dependent RNA helicase RhlE